MFFAKLQLWMGFRKKNSLHYLQCLFHNPDTRRTLPDNAPKHGSLRNMLKRSHNNNLGHVIVDYSHM